MPQKFLKALKHDKQHSNNHKTNHLLHKNKHKNHQKSLTQKKSFLTTQHINHSLNIKQATLS